MARKRRNVKSCKGINSRTGRLKKGYKWQRGKNCPVRATGGKRRRRRRR